MTQGLRSSRLWHWVPWVLLVMLPLLVFAALALSGTFSGNIPNILSFMNTSITIFVKMCLFITRILEDAAAKVVFADNSDYICLSI